MSNLGAVTDRTSRKEHTFMVNPMVSFDFPINPIDLHIGLGARIKSNGARNIETQWYFIGDFCFDTEHNKGITQSFFRSTSLLIVTVCVTHIW